MVFVFRKVILMNNFLPYCYFYLKKKKVLKFLSIFSLFIPSFFLYQIFKNLITVGEYRLCKKIYLVLSKRNLQNDLEEKNFISKVVLIEIQKNLTVEFINTKQEIKYLVIRKFIDNPIRNLNFYSKQNYSPLIIRKIITEFIYCDHLIPITTDYYKAEMVLNMNGFTKNPKIIILDNWWFQALGHIPFIDAFIKAVLLKIINVKKISFHDTKKICNLYLFNKYKEILKKNNLYQEKIVISSKERIHYLKLNIRFWNLSKYGIAHESENVQEYIQKKWVEKNNELFNKREDLRYFELLKKKIGTKSKIVTVHIRQNDFHVMDANANARNSDLNKILKILNQIEGNHLFVIMGAPGNKRIKSKYKNLFDYSNSKYKSQKNDILLLNFCNAFIGNASGPAHYMLTRNKPCLYIDWFPFEMALKNEKCIIMPKLIKKKNKILPFEDFNKLGLRIKYEGITRLNSLGYTLVDNKEEDLQVAIANFVSSLDKKNWKNYGERYLIKNKNFNFFGIRKNLRPNIIKLRKQVFFEPTFVKSHKDFIKK